MYSRCTQFPLQKKENMPKAKSWNVALGRGECIPRVSDHFYSVSHPKPFRAPSPPPHPPWAWCYRRTAEGVPQLTAGPAKPQWLPASVPAGVCSCLHDDLEPALLSGAWHSECSWRRMQRSHTTDTLPSAGCSAPPPWYMQPGSLSDSAHDDERPPLVLFFFVFSLQSPQFYDNLSLLWLISAYF